MKDLAGKESFNRVIRELALRTATGASVVGIERAGITIINTGPTRNFSPATRS